MADKALSALREDLAKLIEPDSSVLDIGCGTGDFLFKVANKVSHGLGVDLDEEMIKFAKRKCDDRQISNLTFVSDDASNLKLSHFDVAASTLCLHEMKETQVRDTLVFMAKNSKRVLIADYTAPKSFFAKFGIEFDEMLSGHYRSFLRYRRAGGIPEYAQKSGLKIDRVISSSIDGIAIWSIRA